MHVSDDTKSRGQGAQGARTRLYLTTADASRVFCQGGTVPGQLIKGQPLAEPKRGKFLFRQAGKHGYGQNVHSPREHFPGGFQHGLPFTGVGGYESHPVGRCGVERFAYGRGYVVQFEVKE